MWRFLMLNSGWSDKTDLIWAQITTNNVTENKIIVRLHQGYRSSLGPSLSKASPRTL